MDDSRAAGGGRSECVESRERGERAGRSVTVWVRTEQLHTDYEGLRLNLIDAIEMALIKKYLPPWNNQVHED